MKKEKNLFDFAAIRKISEEIENNPNDPKNYVNRGIMYWGNKEFSNAKKDFNKAIKLEPNNAWFYHFRGMIYKEQRNNENALKDMYKASEMEPDDIVYIESILDTLISMGRYNKAYYFFGETIGKTHWDGKIYLEEIDITIISELAKHLAYQKQYDKANDIIEKLYEINFTDLNPRDDLRLELNKIKKIKHEHEIKETRIEERNKILADLSHSIKNMISTVIDPLENLKNEKEIKPIVIDNALRGANLIREIVNAMNLSFKGSIKDFHYDAEHNKSKEGLSLQSLLIESIKHSVRNMFDAKYFGNFMRKYFPAKDIYTQAKSDWSSVSQSNNFNEIQKFLNKYFFKTDISFGNAEQLIIGNEKGSAIKLHILFQEIILNAVKYTTFVSKENRFFKLHFSNNEKQIRLLVENTYKPKVKTKTTGLGHVIIENFSKLLQTKPKIKKDDKMYSVEIKFENFWRNKI
ncbi:MAG: tetratricopeptide repeat protein [Candidatus Cloacimonadota bacterium]|nr:tetratricopeptide repeat protein [Candidatus Cloacimonadota bacterium]